MTAKKDLKRRIRERQSTTGERYSTAREQVLRRKPEAGASAAADAPAPQAAVEVELVDVSAAAARAGLACKAFIGAALADALGGRADALGALPVFERLRAALELTEGDPSTESFRRVLLHGLPARSEAQVSLVRVAEESRRFFARLRAGVRGASPVAGLLAFELPSGEAAVAHVLRYPHFVRSAQPPAVIIRTAADLLAALDARRDDPSGWLGWLWVLP